MRDAEMANVMDGELVKCVCGNLFVGRGDFCARCQEQGDRLAAEFLRQRRFEEAVMLSAPEAPAKGCPADSPEVARLTAQMRRREALERDQPRVQRGVVRYSDDRVALTTMMFLVCAIAGLVVFAFIPWESVRDLVAGR